MLNIFANTRQADYKNVEALKNVFALIKNTVYFVQLANNSSYFAIEIGFYRK